MPISLAAVGATFGARHGLPFLFGILLGLCGVMLATMAGLAALLVTWPPRFTTGLILNLVNPKAYAAFVAIFAQFQLPLSQLGHRALGTMLVCLAVAAVVDGLWLWFGHMLRPLFVSERYARPLRIGLACLMLMAVAVSFG